MDKKDTQRTKKSKKKTSIIIIKKKKLYAEKSIDLLQTLNE